MSIKQELIRYSEDCISDKISSGQKHKWACERYLKDIDREDWDYYWDEEGADKIVKWFGYLKHSKGILAGEPITLTTWQKFILCQVYGWRRKDNHRRRFKTSFVEVARKNAKDLAF